MKNKFLLLAAAMLMMTGVASAQSISGDSVKVLNTNNKLLRMAISINDLKLELAKLENKLREEEADQKKIADASQKAADKNKAAATRLSTDDQNEDKADAAKKAAKDAERRSTKARDAQEKLTDIEKRITDLKKEIADNEKNLIAAGGAKYLI